MKQKLLSVEYKHQNDTSNYNDVKTHLINEILELFYLDNTKDGYIIKKFYQNKILEFCYI